MKAFLSASLALATLCSTASAQKIGHADWQYIFSRIPEYRQIETELKTFEGQLQKQMTAKSSEIEIKYTQYRNLPADTPGAIRKDKESELAYLQENLQKFQQEAQRSLLQKQNELMTPVFKRVGKAIEQVAVENGYSYIINPRMTDGDDVLLYSDEKYDISDLVLKKLGVLEGRSEEQKN